MTFTEIVNEVAELTNNLSSPTALTRIGREVNTRYKRVSSAISLNTVRRGTTTSSTSVGVATVTFTGIEKLERVIDERSGRIRVLDEITFDEMRTMTPASSDSPRCYAIER